jgi:hypothetical protein
MFGTLVCSLTHFVEKVPFRALFEENRKARRRMGKRELFVTYSIRLCSNCACLSHKKTPQRIEIKWRKNGGKHLVCCCLEHRTMNSTWSCAPDRLQEDCMVLRILEKNHRTMYINLSSGASDRLQRLVGPVPISFERWPIKSWARGYRTQSGAPTADAVFQAFLQGRGNG